MVRSDAPASSLVADLAYQVTVLVRARAVLDRTRALLVCDADESSLPDEACEPAGQYAAPGVM